ncbi:UvrD-helicase domain-containing protein [Methylorubrum sp. SL192]|uniref:UvrD-helicase domain-containing protein n=1 Tax=Methylorubrum sp. SL192 TaxID=2995167 RepID=UPI002273948F|nr:UvrD-helicase domain-containing protein [Methylorubrum sp. SL192]MCY1640691.1 UvrD-helicase domain-containing protein [Methylorubrum sp. SL192]
MSDDEVYRSLRSTRQLVVIDAAAGCGKTYQAAQYAYDVAAVLNPGRLLILTHTHAACSVFAERVHGLQGRVEIRTIDGLICQIATAYHIALNLPRDPSIWARAIPGGFALLADKVVSLLGAAPFIARALSSRYPVIVCDEHQDSSPSQHAIVMSLHAAGSKIRVFGDPMQRIFRSKKLREKAAQDRHWPDLIASADEMKKLHTPHRWRSGSQSLGEWILEARDCLEQGGVVNLQGRHPAGLKVIFANNQARSRSGYQLKSRDRAPIDRIVRNSQSLMVLSSQNESVRSLRAFFYRQLPIWEGHTRDALEQLVVDIKSGSGDPRLMAEALLAFMADTSRGFSISSHGSILLSEVTDRCSKKRSGKPAAVQRMAKILLDRPDHVGVSQVLRLLHEMISGEPGFQDVKIDLHREFWEAIKLGDFVDLDAGLAELTRRRTYLRPKPQEQTISTVHKAKGLESHSVMVVPCDQDHFGDSDGHRCLLYVALSRACSSLTLVVPLDRPSPLLKL